MEPASTRPWVNKASALMWGRVRAPEWDREWARGRGLGVGSSGPTSSLGLWGREPREKKDRRLEEKVRGAEGTAAPAKSQTAETGQGLRRAQGTTTLGSTQLNKTARRHTADLTRPRTWSATEGPC